MLKPADIHNVEFRRSFKGYNPEDVDDYLAVIIGKYETVYQENRKLREQLSLSQQEAEGKSYQEQDLLDLISLTKQTTSEIKKLANQEASGVISTAKADAARIISEARLEAQRILADAEARLDQIHRSEKELKEKVRLTMETIWNMLDAESDDEMVKTRPYREIIPDLPDLDGESES